MSNASGAFQLSPFKAAAFIINGSDTGIVPPTQNATRIGGNAFNMGTVHGPVEVPPHNRDG